MKEIKYISNNSKATEDIGYNLSKEILSGDIIFLFGPLGAGKTTLLTGLAKGFGFDGVSSPTFTLINVYPTDPVIYHIDLYRIRNQAEFDELGLEEIICDDGISVVEWADKFLNMKWGKRIEIRINTIGENEREVLVRWIE